MTESLVMSLPPEAVEAIARRAAELVLEQLEPALTRSPRWLYGAQAAADYLGWPVGRVQKLTSANALPCHRACEGGRVSYRTDELDGWLEEQREGPGTVVRALRRVR